MLNLAAILTHDLSNPLQSITVLCELGMEDDDVAEAPRRAQQSLQAAERMRDLLHAYAALVRNTDRPGRVVAALDRATAMFGRRFERHRITLEQQVEREFDGPASTDLAMVTLMLGIVAAAEAASGPFQARIVVDEGTLEVRLQDADGSLVNWPTPSVESIADCLGSDGSASFADGVLSIRMKRPAA